VSSLVEPDFAFVVIAVISASFDGARGMRALAPPGPGEAERLIGRALIGG